MDLSGIQIMNMWSLSVPHYGIKICNSDQFYYFLMQCDAYYELKVCNMQHFNAELIYNLNVYVNRMLFIQIPTTVFPHSLVFSVLFNFTFWSFLAVDFFLGLLLLPLKKDLITYTNAETATLLLKKIVFFCLILVASTVDLLLLPATLTVHCSYILFVVDDW